MVHMLDRGMEVCCLFPGYLRRHKKAHIIPGLEHALLISITVLCKTGCKKIYEWNIFKIFCKGKLVWLGTKDPSTDL